MNKPGTALTGARLSRTHNRSRTALTLLLISFLSTTTVAQTEDTELDQKAVDTTEEIGLLQRSINALRSSIDQFTGKQEKLEREVRDSEQAIAASMEKVQASSDKLSAMEAGLDELEQEEEELTASREQQQNAVSEAIREAYKHGKQNRLKLILNQQDPAEVERLLKYYDFLGRARQDKIAAYARTLTRLSTSKASQQKARDSIEVQRATLEQEHRELEAAQAQRELALSELTAQVGTATRQLTQQVEKRDRLADLLKQIETRLSELKLPYGSKDDPFEARKGEMSWPVEGSISNKYGGLKPNSRLHWEGIQLSAADGQDIRAIHGGRVVFADWFSSQGLMVVIDHGDRYLSLYAHNSSILKKTGQLVSANEVIATVGNSGGQSNPGVYFEIRSKGEPVNPVAWCRK